MGLGGMATHVHVHHVLGIAEKAGVEALESLKKTCGESVLRKTCA